MERVLLFPNLDRSPAEHPIYNPNIMIVVRVDQARGMESRNVALSIHSCHDNTKCFLWLFLWDGLFLRNTSVILQKTKKRNNVIQMLRGYILNIFVMSHVSETCEDNTFHGTPRTVHEVATPLWYDLVTQTTAKVRSTELVEAIRCAFNLNKVSKKDM